MKKKPTERANKKPASQPKPKAPKKPRKKELKPLYLYELPKR